MADDKDPFAAFGGKALTQTSDPDPFSAFGGKVIKKTSPTVNVPSFNNGVGLINQQSAELSPALPQYRNAIRERQLSDAKKQSDQLRKIYSELPEEGKRNWENAMRVAANKQPDTIREPSAEEVAHERFMETPAGKALGIAGYMGSKATKGITKAVEGLVWLANKGKDPFGINQPAIDVAFDKIDENTNFGLTRTDLQNIEENALTRNLGTLAEVAPIGMLPGGAPTQMAAFGLQGIGSGKDQIEQAEKESGPINPLVKDAFILGNGVAMAALMKIPLFKSIPTGLKGDVAASLTTNAIKEAAGKELTGAEFRSLLDKGVEQFSQKLKQGGLNYLRNYNKAMVDLGALKTADFVLKEGVNAVEGREVFEQNLGDLASGLQELATVEAPIFAGAGVIPDATKLFKGGSYKNSVVESLMFDPSEGNLAKTKDEIMQIAEQEGWSNNEINSTIDHIDKLGAVAKKLPRGIKPEKIEDAVDIALGRDELKAQLAEATTERSGRDESVAEILTPEEQLLQDKIDQANDKLRSMATGERVYYGKEKDEKTGEETGKFYKLIEGNREEITKSRYELESLEREAKRERDTAVEAPVSEQENTAPVETDISAPVGETIDAKEKPPVIIKNAEGRPYTLEEINDGIKGVEAGTIKYPGDAEMADIVKYRDYLAKNEQAPVREKAVADVKVQPTEPAIKAKDSAAPVEVEATEEVTINPVRQKAIDAITHGVVGIERHGETGPRFDLGIPVAEQKRAIRDITNGKYETAAAKKMIDKVAEFEANGEYPIIEGTGGATVRSRAATAQEIQENIDSAKQYQLAKEQNIEANNKGLKDLGITHEDILAYENYRRAGEPGTISDNRRATGDATGNVQRPENDKAASKPQNSGGKAVQGESGTERAGDPLRAFASKLRDGKISKLGGFRTGTGFETVWDASLEVVATAAEGGAKIADAIEAGLKHIKQTDWYKNLTEKEKFDTEYRKHLKSEYDVVEQALPAKNEANKIVAEGLGLKVDKSATGKRTNEVIEREATEAIKEGYDTPDLVERILSGEHTASDTEVAILAKYRDVKEREIKEQQATLAESGATMSKKKFLELSQANEAALLEMQDVVQAIRKTGSATGSALRARQMEVKKEDTLANFIVQKRQALGGEKLTAEQLAEVTKTVNELEATKKALEERLKKVDAENTKLKAEQTVKRNTPSKRTTAKAELATERAKIFESIRADLKKIRQSGTLSSDIPYRRELAAISKHIPALLRNLAQEGVVRIEDVVDNIYNTLKPELEEITKRDVTDLIAGKYDEVKPTRSDLQNNIRALREQAKLINQIEDAERGIKSEKKPERLKKRNEQVEALRKRLDTLLNGEELTPEEKSLSALKKRLQGNIDKLSKRIADGDYSKDEPRKPVPMDAEALELRRKYDKIKREFDLQVARDHLNQRTKTQKRIDDLINITALPRALKSSFDFSAVGRQGLFLAPHLKESKTAFKEMFGQAFSEKRYDDWISDLKHTELYDLMKESGLYIADKSDPKLMAREEMFTSTLAERIPGVKQSERAYTAYLNVLRTGVFESEARKLMERGYTPEADPKEFESLARVINILSGRGEIPKSWGHSAPKVLSLGLFSPRFLAARLQTLYLWADPTLSKNAKILAAKDIGSVLGSGALLLGLAAAAGYKVSIDPTSTNFLKIEDEEEEGSTYYDITGGLAQYVRLLAQLGSGTRTSAAGNVTNLWDDRNRFTNPWGITPLDVLGSFARGKLAPVPGMVINLLDKKDVVGNPYGFGDVPFEFVPLPMSDVREAYKVGGIDNGLKVLIPTQFGIGASSYQAK